MTRSHPDWVVASCARLLGPDAAADRPRLAAQLGAQAAEQGVDLRDLVAAVLAAATSHSSTARPTDVAQVLTTVGDILDDAIVGYHDRTRAELSTQDKSRGEFVNDLLNGRADPGWLAQRAGRYGIRLAGTHSVTVARVDGLTPGLVHDLDRALVARYGAGNILTAIREQHLVCISAGGLRGLPAELAHHLLARLGPGPWQIGVGRAHAGLEGIATSLDEAVGALDLAARLGFTARVLNAADLLVFPVLLRDRAAITDLVTTVLGPLVKARGGARPYLDTLTVLLDNQGNHTAAARQLHLSVRAVSYRLDRIQALTGYHPNEPTQRFTLHAAVLGARLLGWPDPGDLPEIP